MICNGIAKWRRRSQYEAATLNRLQQRPLLGLLVNPFGTTFQAMELDRDYLRVTRRGLTSSVSLEAISAAPLVRKGAVAASMTDLGDKSSDVCYSC